MAVTEDILVRLRVQGQQQFAGAMGTSAAQTGRLGTAADTAGGELDALGKKAKAAEARMGGFARKTGGLSRGLKTASGTMLNLGGAARHSSLLLGVAGAAVVGLGGILTTFGALAGVALAVGLGTMQVYKKTVDQAGSAAARLKAAFGGVQKAFMQAMGPAANIIMGALARALRTLAPLIRSLRPALTVFGKAAASSIKVFSRALVDMGPQLRDLIKAVAPLMRQMGPLVAAFLELGVALAIAFAPAALQIVTWLTELFTLIASNKAALIVFGVALAAIGAAILGVVLGAEGLAVAIAALVAAIIVGFTTAYAKSELFRNAVDLLFATWKKMYGLLLGGVKAAFNWLIGALPEAWAIIRNAPIIWLIRNFGRIRGAVVAAFNVVKRAATTAWGAVKRGATAAWSWVKTAAGNAAKFVTNAWQRVVGFFRGVGGKIRSATAGMWDGIKDAFRSAINWVIGAWNSLSFKLPKIEAFGQSVGGTEFQVPQIAPLASGGPAAAGSPYLVGEQGPELFVPGTSGTVIPNGAGGPIHTHVYLNGREIATAVGNAAADRKARR